MENKQKEPHWEAFHRLVDAAFGKQVWFASIPANPRLDADLIVMKALEERDRYQAALEAIIGWVPSITEPSFVTENALKNIAREALRPAPSPATGEVDRG